ncbi:response regulator [Microbulbifer taiwanensis]|uniref:histidine kinase n=1 Tax=Microbulbifer taiwanensis TaxID=986746 RepID=A0ABW1YS95_9GAMM|nr:response regulator [Microbulbifer taiwanensis]
MTKTITRGEAHSPGFALRAATLGGLASASTLWSAAAAAASPSLTDTQVALLWPALLATALLAISALALSLWLRLGRETAEATQRASAQKIDNSNLHRQLQSYSTELSSREKQLAEARKNLERQRQENTDMLAIIGHHLRQPLEALRGTLGLLARSGASETTQLVTMAQRQLQTAIKSMEELQKCDGLETVELKLPAQQPKAESRPLSILLVENDNDESLRNALESRGHRVQRENNGVDGADAALQKEFDLILIDSHLPLMDGVEATQKIRRGAGRELPIFALLREPRAGDRERYRDRGLTGVLARPVSDFQLQQLLSWAGRRARDTGEQKPARPTRLLNTSTLCRQRDTLGHLPFAELLSDRSATLPKRTTALTSALTGRHWPDAEHQAQAIAASAEELGLEAVAARLRALAARLSIDSEREYCRHQRTELLNLMRASVQQLKAWREENVHTEWALR